MHERQCRDIEGDRITECADPEEQQPRGVGRRVRQQLVGVKQHQQVQVERRAGKHQRESGGVAQALVTPALDDERDDEKPMPTRRPAPRPA